MDDRKCQIVYTANEAGLCYLQALRRHEKRYCAIALDTLEKSKLLEEGVDNVWLVDPEKEPAPFTIDCPISKVVVFLDDIAECCKLIPFLHNWFGRPLFVISRDNKPMLMSIYKRLGASYVLHTQGNDVSFLAND